MLTGTGGSGVFWFPILGRGHTVLKKLKRDMIFILSENGAFSANRGFFHELEYDVVWLDSRELRRGLLTLKVCQLVEIAHLSDEQFDVIELNLERRHLVMLPVVFVRIESFLTQTYSLDFTGRVEKRCDENICLFQDFFRGFHYQSGMNFPPDTRQDNVL